MEYSPLALDTLTSDKALILCCECGTQIEPNPTNMCVGCLRTKVDITEGIPKQATLYFCKKCERYLHPPGEWIKASLESRELMTLCLKKLKGLNRVKLIDASFVWTEPHSKRIKIKLTVHGEIMTNATLEQIFIVEYVISNQMCEDCHRTEAKDYWSASVQVRQKTINKKTFYYLEQLILKHRAHENTIGIKSVHDGLDFFYNTEANARKLVDFIISFLPCRYQQSKKLISHDIHNNTYNYKFSYSIEIVPISKDSVVCLSKKLTHQLGNLPSICVVYRVTSYINVIDVSSGQIAEISSNLYWRYPFQTICNPKQLKEYIVIDVELIKEKDKKKFPGQGNISHKFAIADIWVVKSEDLGLDQNTIHTRTHLGGILKPGDSVLGYDLSGSNINDENFEKLDQDTVPDVILIKKFYGTNRSSHRRARLWKLKHLNENMDINSENNDYNEFLDELEEDPELRANINIFRDNQKQINNDTSCDDSTLPQITLEEMLDDLVITDSEMIE
ncbi:PREDICTED: 60S ribosomal export protein NMD3 [Ceratosolen solmsi marchali]|uniref:60S ribosomal export protein NMD3 n=1 Tax=Ceratosolen solmsi marchali TaxID=326594 RepID=A0AAJ6YVQ2_9HYME|nr:PREDICTED: 60S ribosomal export protein NMD3 [Ceratosolen solmsi marchali]